MNFGEVLLDEKANNTSYSYLCRTKFANTKHLFSKTSIIYTNAQSLSHFRQKLLSRKCKDHKTSSAKKEKKKKHKTAEHKAEKKKAKKTKKG